jgi:His-Xaa-Ser system protein HxsD
LYSIILTKGDFIKKDVNFKGINNLEIYKKDGYLIVSINPKIYPLEVIYSATYVFLDRAYLLIDGNPEEEIFVQMKPKDKKEDLEKLGNEFNNELVNYAVYVVQSIRNQPLRKAIIERALLTNTAKAAEFCNECGCKLEICPDCGEIYCPACESKHSDEPPKEEEFKKEDYIIDDPLGIAKPWEPPKGELNEKSKNKQKSEKN